MSIDEAVRASGRGRPTPHQEPTVTTSRGDLAVDARGVVKRYGRTVILDHVDLAVRTGRVTVLLGANGAGKSTLIRLMCDLAKPSAGRLSVLGAAPGSRPNEVGVLFEDPNVYPHLDGWTNLRILAGRPLSAEPDRSVLDYLGLSHEILRRKGKGLSFGQRRRLTLAALLWRDARLLILDEPTNGLDPDGIEAFVSTVRSVKDDGSRTLLITGQALDAFDALADDVLILQDGKVRALDDWQSQRTGRGAVASLTSRRAAALAEHVLGRQTPSAGGSGSGQPFTVSVAGDVVDVRGNAELVRALVTELTAAGSVWDIDSFQLRSVNLQDLLAERRTTS